MLQIAFADGLKLCDGAVINSQIVFTIKARWIEDVIQIGGMLVERD